MRKLAILGAASTLLLAGEALARPVAPQVFCETYPNVPVCLSGVTCQTCHVETTPTATWNSYGEALAAEVPNELGDEAFAAALPGALAAIEGLDSDQDGFDNYDELLGGSSPGDASSTPGDLACPDDPWALDYPICEYDPRLAFRRIHLDVCGRSPTYEAYQAFVAKSTDEQMASLHDALDTCLDSEFWVGKNGVLWQLAHRKVRPVGALKSGEDEGFIGIGDYYNDYALFAWSQMDDHDVRSVLTADFFVARSYEPTTTYTKTYEMDPNGCGQGCSETMQEPYRAGMITSRWYLVYNIMFTAMPRTAAAQAYRAYLGYDIAQMQGLYPIDGEPVSYDSTGVDAPECATCHSTLDPLTYPFRNYNGLTGGLRGQYVPLRMETFFEDKFPGISETPESGYLLGQPVKDLVEWARVAADSEAFARATVLDYYELFVGRQPSGQAEADELATLVSGLMGEHEYSVERMLHDLIETESYGAP